MELFYVIVVLRYIKEMRAIEFFVDNTEVKKMRGEKNLREDMEWTSIEDLRASEMNYGTFSGVGLYQPAIFCNGYEEKQSQTSETKSKEKVLEMWLRGCEGQEALDEWLSE